MPELQRNPAQDYLDAERPLVEPHTVAITDHDGRPLGERLEAPLLLTLAANVTAGVMRGGGAGSPAHTRTPMNVGAADLHHAIRGAVLAEYAERVGGGAQPDTIPALKALRLVRLNDHRAGRLTTGQLDARSAVLQGWARAIGDLLDPPFRIDLLAPCPRCGETHAIDADGDQVAALCTTYRDVAEAMHQCRACGALWHGIDGARRLRIAIDQAEHMRAVLLGVA